MNDKHINKYNYFLFILITLQIFGNYGGALQPVRIAVFLLLPFFLFHSRKLLYYKFEFSFFCFWILYSLFSLLWVSDYSEAFNEISYLIINTLCFFTVILLAEKANNPKKTIIMAWMFLFVLTVPIALYELIFDVHLSNSVFEGNRLIGRADGGIKKFAAVTFSNYNTYVQLLLCVFPFLASFCLSEKSFRKQLLGWILILILLYILLMIASRSGLIGLLIGLLILFYYFKKTSLQYKFIVYICVFVTVAGSLFFWREQLLEQLAYRLVDSELFQDSSRSDLIGASFQMLWDTCLLGVGAGNFVSASSVYLPMNSLPPHNFFMEILSQYGFFLFFSFLMLIVRILFCKKENVLLGFILTASLFLFPFVSVVNSIYIRSVLIWLWIASLFILSKKKFDG